MSVYYNYVHSGPLKHWYYILTENQTKPNTAGAISRQEYTHYSTGMSVENGLNWDYAILMAVGEPNYQLLSTKRE